MSSSSASTIGSRDGWVHPTGLFLRYFQGLCKALLSHQGKKQISFSLRALPSPQRGYLLHIPHSYLTEVTPPRIAILLPAPRLSHFHVCVPSHAYLTSAPSHLTINSWMVPQESASLSILQCQQYCLARSKISINSLDCPIKGMHLSYTVLKKQKCTV